MSETANEKPVAEERGRKKTIRGVVISDKADKTVRVAMERRVLHRTYKKYVVRKKTFMAHDEKNECKVGDQVLIVESRPLSRLKRWRVKEILEKAR